MAFLHVVANKLPQQKAILNRFKGFYANSGKGEFFKDVQRCLLSEKAHDGAAWKMITSLLAAKFMNEQTAI